MTWPWLEDLKRKIETCNQKLADGIDDSFNIDVNVYAGDVTASVKGGKLDWKSVLSNTVTQGKVKMVVSQRINILDGDNDLIITDDPSLQGMVSLARDLAEKGVKQAYDQRLQAFEAVNKILAGLNIKLI